jgi:hypothetical protein
VFCDGVVQQRARKKSEDSIRDYPVSFTYIASASSIDFLLAGCDGSAS